MSVCSFVFLTNYAIAGMSPAFYVLSLEFRRSEQEITKLLLWPVFMLGHFNFFWVPMANICKSRLIEHCTRVLAHLCQSASAPSLFSPCCC